MFLENDKVRLRSLVSEDSTGPYKAWLNDPAVCEFNNWHRFPQTEEQLLEFIIQSRAGGTRALILAVETIADGTHVGNISLQSIDWITRQAEFAILIGEPTVYGKGVGFSAASLIIHHGFTAMNLNRIHCGTSQENQGMQRLADKLGFVKEGLRREALFKSGQYVDVIEYGLLRAEWPASLPDTN